MVVASARVDDPSSVFDVGERFVERLHTALISCRTIFWNGPLGRYERADGMSATAALAGTLVSLRRAGAHIAVGGGDTIAALHRAGVAPQVGFLSSAGGAALAFMAQGDELPGIRPLVVRAGTARS